MMRLSLRLALAVAGLLSAGPVLAQELHMGHFHEQTG